MAKPRRLVHESGINRTYLSGVERSERNVSIDNIARIARGLKVKLGRCWTTASNDWGRWESLDVHPGPDGHARAGGGDAGSRGDVRSWK